MNSPLGRALETLLDEDRARLYMPGHKGDLPAPLGEAARWDLTEIEGADSLYHADGPILETERAFAAFYGARDSLLSAGGSTLCIQAMLALALRPGERLLIGRGAHTAAVHAMALLDVEPLWLWPGLDGATGLAQATTPDEVAAALREHPEARAVYLTSPNYYGCVCDVGGIAAVCHARGVPLLVDNAHGAHLPLLRDPALPHPMAAGADLCCDSLHKTLPVLTGGALLHVGNPIYRDRARAMMALFGSTSPSYLILLSAAEVLGTLHAWSECSAVRDTCARLDLLRVLARSRGLLLPGGVTDPMRLSVSAAPLGYDAQALAAQLRVHGVEPEFAGGRWCVLLATPHNMERDFARVREALETLTPGAALPPENLDLPRPERAVPLREALFAAAQTVPTEQAAGRIAGALVAPCPPGVSLVTPGERIPPELVAALKNSGIRTVPVLQ